jgi:hypothetical protein
MMTAERNSMTTSQNSPSMTCSRSARAHTRAVSQKKNLLSPFRRSATLALIAILVWPSLAASQGTVAPIPILQFFNVNGGSPLNGGKLCTYAAGTSTPLATYSDVTLTTPHANPIILNSAGRPASGGTVLPVYLSAASYKFVLMTAGSDSTCSTGTTVWTSDNVQAVPATSANLDVTATAGEAISAREVVYMADGSSGTTAGRWYKADADAIGTSISAKMVGLATTAIASGSTGTVRLSGRITGLTGLTAGTEYYVSTTAGALTATPVQNLRFVGAAESTTVLVVQANPRRSPIDAQPPASELTIASGAITPTASWHTVDTEADAAEDDLDTINTTNLPEYSRLTLTSVGSGRLVRVRSAVGNIFLDLQHSTTDAEIFTFYTLTDQLTLQLVGGLWREVSRSPAANQAIHTFRAVDNEAPTSNPATVVSRNDHDLLAFDDTTDESAMFAGLTSSRFHTNSARLEVAVYWVAASATANAVRWDMAFENDTAQSVTTTTDATSGVLNVSTITFTSSQIDSLTAGTPFRLKVTRDANHAADTLVGDAQVKFVVVRELH